MTLIRGITLLDLIDQLPAGLQGFLPTEITRFFELLAVIEHRSSTSGDYFIHHGLIQSAEDAGLNLQGFPLVIPGLNRGIRFQLSFNRQGAATPPALEDTPSGWQLDLLLDEVSLPLPGVKPATLIPSAPAAPAHLVPDTSRTTVRLMGRGVLRITGGASGTSAQLIAAPDPLDPSEPVGTVVELQAQPRHMLFHSSGLGMTLDTITLDQSDTYTPPDIVARGHDASWQGLSLKEATLFLPRGLPIFGDISLGVKDVLIGLGSSSGLQGEAHLEFGRPSVNISNLLVYQELNGAQQQLAGSAVTGSGRAYTVALDNSTGPVARVRVRYNTSSSLRWKLPGSADWLTGNDTGWFTVNVGSNTDVLIYREIGADDAEGPDHTFTFQRASELTLPHPPKVDVTLGSTTWANVTSLSGAASLLSGVQFSTNPSHADATWTLNHAGQEVSARGATFSPSVSWAPGRHWLVLADAAGRRRRLEIELLTEGRLLVGAQAGTRQYDGSTESAINPTAVESSHHLESFHRDGSRTPAPSEATLSGTTLTVPEGVLAKVALELGTPEDPEEPRPPVSTPVAHARVLMDFDATTPRRMRLLAPEPVDSTTSDPFGRVPPWPRFGSSAEPAEASESAVPFTSAALSAWTQTLPAGTRFVVIGRCDDIGTSSYNAELGERRADAGRALLVGLPLQSGTIADSDIYSRGENKTTGQGTQPTAGSFQEVSSQPSRTLSGRTPQEWQITNMYSSSERASWGSTQALPQREEYRCVDIYAAVPLAASTTQPTPEEDSLSPSRRTVLVPGADRATPSNVQPRDVELGYRVLLRARWDSPTFVDAGDAIPTLVELTVDWESAAQALPGGGGDVQAVPPDGSTSTPMVFQVLGRFTHDPRSGETVFTLAFDTPGDDRGLFRIVSPGSGTAGEALAVAMGFGPALLSGIDSADPGSAAVRIGALLGAVAAVTALNIIDRAEVSVQRLEIEHRQSALGEFSGSKTRLTFDYTVELKVSAPDLGLTSEKPVKIRYVGVGVEYDNSRSGLDAINLVYDDCSFEIADPGQWRMDGWLGDLLGVTAVRLGAGSIWFEIELAFALDLGVVEVSKATVRITIDGGSVSVELRGLAASVNVPNVIEASGQLEVGSAAVSASLDVNIIPAKIRGWAALSLQDPMVHVEGGVRFATPIPLFNSGLGIFGFMGRFVSHGTRNLPGNSDPVEREVAWYNAPTLSKYRPEEGQFALGLGAVVGTLPDFGLSFNAEGMLAVEFPDPSVVFGINASFLFPPGQAAEQGSVDLSSPSLKLLGLIAVNSQGLAVGIRGSYVLPKLLDLKVPVSAWFPFTSSSSSYVRIGSDGYGGRPNQPVSLTVLPDLLDLKAWSYFMVEEKNLLNLGGKGFDFYGFALGFGAGWSLRWGGGPIYLKASASVVAGLGSRPFVLMGAVDVRGELWLVVAGISVRGSLTLKLADAGSWLKGEFCGKIKLLFFSIEGCVEFRIGSDPGSPAPEPEPLISGVTLTDKFARVVGETRADGGVLGAAHTAWPDAVPVAHFNHRVDVALPATGFQPSPANGWPGNDWAGSANAKYLYKLTGIELLEDGVPVDTTGWPSTWWLPAFRSALPEGDEAPSSEHEGWDLALLQWDPAPWSRNLSQGGEGIPADPAETVSRICDPVERATRGCVHGSKVKRLSAERVRFLQGTLGSGPYASKFVLEGELGLLPGGLSAALNQAAALGRQYSPGRVLSLPQPYTPPEGEPAITAGYLLPSTSYRGVGHQSLGFDGDFISEVVDPELTLALYLLMTPPGVVDVCTDFTPLKVGQQPPNPYLNSNIKFTDLGGSLTTADVFPRGAPDRVVELRYSRSGLRVDLPEATDQVRLWVGLVDPVTGGKDPYLIYANAYSSSGALLASARTPDTSGTLHLLQLNAQGIAYVILTGGAGMGLVQKVCYNRAEQRDYEKEARDTFNRIIAKDPQANLPKVLGVRQDDSTEPWRVTVGALGVRNNEACLFLHYRPERPEEPWYGLQILPWQQGRVVLVSACAMTVAALQQQAEAQQAHDSLANAWNNAVTGTEQARHTLLKAGKTYTLRFSYTAARWQRSDSSPNPPSRASFTWTSGGGVDIFNQTQSFQFKTALAGSIPEESLLDFKVQSTFEPAAVVRYLRGFDPAQVQPPHFLDDDLRAFFDVEWVETLLDRYNHTLELRVARTDPPPREGGVPPVLQVPITVLEQSLPLALQPLADQRMAEAARAAPCLQGIPQHGATHSAQGSLEPRAEYDFIALAVPGGGGSEVVIGRSHFRTSRYRSPQELMEAVGFSSVSSPNPLLPYDAVLTGALPAQVQLDSDQGMDEALQAMGLDPWPLPSVPRTVLLWEQAGSSWRLAGVLLDSDEPMIRPARTGEEQARVEVQGAQVDGHTLSVRRTNAAGTRVLLAPASPVSLSASSALELRLSWLSLGVTSTGARYIPGVPHLVSKEQP